MYWMQTRAQSVLVQVWLALVCALGAGFSGDMYTRTVAHGTQHARHTRGNQHRNQRASSRDTHGDHAHEIDIRQESARAVQTQSRPDAPFALVAPRIPAVQFHAEELISVPQVGFLRAARSLQLPARAPPAVA